MTTGQPADAASAAANLAEAYFELGAFEDAQRYAERVLQLDQRFAAPYAYFTLGQIAIARGDTATAIRLFTQSTQLAQSNQAPFMFAYAVRALGLAHREAGDRAEDESLIPQALEQFRQLDLPAEVAATEQLLECVAV